MKKHIVLFDIDGTLLSAGGAGIASCELAFEALFGLREVWGDTLAHGKTDHLIFQEIAERVMRRTLCDDELSHVADRYLNHLRDEIMATPRFRVHPGVEEICAAFAEHPAVLLGLETGNIEAAAWLKLERANLRQHFCFGGFGSDSPHRPEIVRIAIERAQALCNHGAAKPADVVVIGDAPQDVIAGREVGARTIAVLTGRANRDDLEALGADLILDDLSDIASLMNFVCG